MSREGHGRDRVSLNYRSFMFGKLPPPACPGLCYNFTNPTSPKPRRQSKMSQRLAMTCHDSPKAYVNKHLPGPWKCCWKSSEETELRKDGYEWMKMMKWLRNQ